jgi:4-hydroxybenzoate polyprenyltransferase
MSSQRPDTPPPELSRFPGYLHVLDHWFLARPVLMPPVWTIVLLAAVPQGILLPFDILPPFAPRIWGGLVLCFFLAGAVYILNQVFDIASDRANDKLFFLHRGVVSLQVAVMQSIAFLLLAVGGGWFLGRVWFACTVLLALLGLAYSMPVFRLKDRPFAGLVANAVGHGVLVYYLGRALVEPDSIPPGGASVSYALAVAGVYLLTTVPDRGGDAAAGKRTMSVAYGPHTTSALAAFCVLGALVTAVVYRQWPMALAAGISWPLFVGAVISEKFCGSAIRVALLLLSFFACLAFLPYFLILVGLFFSTRWYYRRRFGIVYPRLGARG